ncbi:MAG: MTH938/NDUFAF3 family protein [Phreatobacter sp.]|nr:MTH938/NDUFAF3 family protein [Phreatobacter sp.]
MPRGELPKVLHNGFVPGRFAIDAYGSGGFRFADMSHRGSILALPSGIHAWSVTEADAIDTDALRQVLAESRDIDVLLMGMGSMPHPLADGVRWALRETGIGVDVMTTGAAARTYNIMLGEKRRVAAALVAIG